MQAPGDHRQRDAGAEQPGDLARGREIAKAVEAVARLDQAEHRELLDHLAGSLLSDGELVGRVGLGLLVRHRLAEPFEELPLAGDRNAIGLRLRRGCSTAGRRRAAASRTRRRSAHRSRLVTPSRGLPPRSRTSANASARFIDASRPVKATMPFELGAVGFGVMPQRPAFLLAAGGGAALVLAAAGFFLVSAPMLARSASIRLMTRCGAAPSSFGA